MKAYTLDAIMKMLKGLLKHGHGKLIVYVVDGAVPRCEYTESRKPDSDLAEQTKGDGE